MATKKVLVEINVEQKGSALEKTTKNVKELTAVEKERLKIKKDTERTDAKLEVVNDKATKNLEKRKKDLKDVNDLSKTWTGIMKESVAQIGKTNDGLKNLNADYALWEKQSAAAAKQQEKLNKELEDEQIKLFQAQVKKLTKDETLLEKQTKKLAFAQSDEAKKLAIVAEQTKRANYELSQYAKEQVDAANATENTNDKMQKFKTTSGLTGAIVTEFGRTASDASYGIRGMGNNISQIVTLFGQLQANTVKAGGTMKDSFNQIFQSMKGIIGVMTALQIVLGVIQSEWFQKWVSGLFNVNTKLKEFKKLMKEASDTAGASQGNFNTYIKVLRDTSSSLEEQQAAIEKLNREYPDFNTNILTNTNNQDAQNIAVERYNDLLLERARSEAALSKIQESSSRELELIREKDKKAVKLGLKDFKTVSSVAKRLREEQDSIISGRAKGAFGNEEIFVQDGDFGQVKLRKNQLIQLEKLNEEAIKKEKDLQKGLFDFIKIESGKQTTTDKDSLERRVSRFKETRLLLQSELQKSENELKKTTFRTNKEIIQDEGESSKDVIKIKTDEFKKREELRLENFINQKKIDREREGITQAEKDKIDKAIEEAEETSAKTIELADKEATKVIESITKVTNARISNKQRLDEVNQRKRDDSVEEGRLDLLANLMSEGMQKILAEEELAQLRYDNKVARANEDLALDTLTEDQRRDLETQKSLWSQQKAQEDLDFDIAMIEERFRVQQEYIGFISQTSGVLQAIGNKNKEWQKTQLILEKGAAIAGVVTQAAKSIAAQTASQGAATGLETTTAAALNSISFGTAGTAYLATKKSDISAETAKGIAKTKASAGLSIAAITAGAVSGLNSISNSGGGSSGGGGGSATVQPPDFNIVGSTGVNQLADAIGSTEKEPVKAFVVASDVTTQQALDRNNRNNAEL